MRRVFKTKVFNRWMRKTELTDRSLCDAVSEMEAALKMLASDLLKLSSEELNQQVERKALVEICHEDQGQGERPYSRRRS